MSRDFDAEIRKKEEEVGALNNRLAEIMQVFIEQTTSFVLQSYGEIVETYVSKSPDVTLNLGIEKIKKMKADVKQLQDSAKDIVNEFVSDPERWWHLSENNKLSYHYSRTVPPFLDEAIRLAIGKVGPILEEFGYPVKTKAIYASDYDAWVERDSHGYADPMGRPCLPRHKEWSKEMKATFNNYSELVSSAMMLRSEIMLLMEQKKTAQAKDLWDSVQ